MDLVKKKISGVSILESLVAMAIILLTLALSAGVYAGIASNKKGMKTVLFQNECERIFSELEKEKTPENKIISEESFNYELKIKPYMNSKNLSEVAIVVYEKQNEQEGKNKGGKKLFEYKRLLLNENKNDF
ncbi:MAG: hypothetical protein IAF38_16940 [Bacteroidia bacterium]|nr:hypothetical protein [Bacteroidia bacterium]